MVEVKKKVETFAVYACCESCKVNLEYMGRTLVDLEYTGRTPMSNPPKYLHKCPVCGYEENLNDLFPKITYEFVE